jgi:hypothetical protein
MLNRKVVLLLFIGAVIDFSLFGQDVTRLGQQLTQNVIQTPVPFLNIAPDSRAGAMGDLGVATSPDLNSLHWNAAKYAFLDDEMGVAASYSPWLHNIVSDVNLLYLTLFKRIDKQSTATFGIRYFSLGDIVFTNEYNVYQGQKKTQ